MEKKGKIDALTGIRFFAAACIVLFHANNVLGASAIAASFSLIQGVSLFFVLSGFILTYNYPVIADKSDAGRFLLARIARIWPLHIAAILLLLFWVPTDLHNYWPAGQKKLIMLLNFFLLQSWIPIGDFCMSMNAVAWSISVEMFFYLMFPLLLWQWKKTWPVKILLSAGLVAAAIAVGNYWHLPVYDPGKPSLYSILYFHPIPRLFEFIVGIAAYFIYLRLLPAVKDKSTAWMTMVECICLAFAVGSMWWTAHAGQSAFVTTVLGAAGMHWLMGSGSVAAFAILIVAVALQKGLLARFLGSRPLVVLGEISFAMYLTHGHLLHVYNYNNFYTRFAGWDLQLGYLVYWMAALGMAYLFFVGVEQPCRRWMVALPRRISQWRENGLHTGVFMAMPGKAAVGSLVVLLAMTVAVKYAVVRQDLYIDRLSASEAAAEIDISRWNDPAGALFGQEIRLLSADTRPVDDDNYSIQLIWRAERETTLRYYVALHFLDKDGQLIGQRSYFQQPARLTVAGNTIWRDRILMERELLPKVDKLAIVFTERPGEPALLLPVTAAHTDWNGVRLLIGRSVFSGVQPETRVEEK